ncbi:MAG: YsnF/AvaK domain-containing protein [Bryobacteraceae bacterium]
MQSDDHVTVIPVVAERLSAEAAPVQTGAVRVTKRVIGEDQVVEQQLRKEHAEIKRIRVNRPVDGPQEPYRSGNTLIIPVMAEVIQIEKRLVVAEEIHITKYEDLETVTQDITVSHEEAEVQRFNEMGEEVDTPSPRPRILTRAESRDTPPPLPSAAATTPASSAVRREVLTDKRKSMLRKDPKG